MLMVTIDEIGTRKENFNSYHILRLPIVYGKKFL